jgi:sirohydrochlorin cobaltochelatase
LKEGLVLFAHGSREPRWAKPFEDLAARLSAEFLVELAYLEVMKPTLSEAVASLADAGAKSVRIFPVFLAAGGHIRQDLPKLVAQARERHPALRIVLEKTIGEEPQVMEAIAAVISRISREPG